MVVTIRVQLRTEPLTLKFVSLLAHSIYCLLATSDIILVAKNIKNTKKKQNVLSTLGGRMRRKTSYPEDPVIEGVQC